MMKRVSNEKGWGGKKKKNEGANHWRGQEVKVP